MTKRNATQLAHHNGPSRHYVAHEECPSSAFKVQATKATVAYEGTAMFLQLQLMQLIGAKVNCTELVWNVTIIYVCKFCFGGAVPLCLPFSET